MPDKTKRIEKPEKQYIRQLILC